MEEKQAIKLTLLETKLLNEIIIPSIGEPQNDYLYGSRTISESLNYTTLLREIKSFYKRNGGKEWDRVLSEALFVKL